MKKWWIALGVLVIFLGLRLLQLQQSFWFFGDLGRDLFVLQEWASDVFHPPLLGPQTSVISFNQSAWYYYYLFPFFVVLKHSIYSTLIATIAFYSTMIVSVFVVLKNKKQWWRGAVLLYLIAIHPQFVLQHRYVWNPSLVTPFLLAGFWAWWKYQQHRDWKWLAILAASLAAAAGLNFSLVPTVLIIVGLFVWEQRKNWQGIWQLLIFGVCANLAVHLPTLLFEIRHNFLLTKNLPTQELLQQEPSLLYKTVMLLFHLFTPTQFMFPDLLVGLGVMGVFAWVVLRSQKLRSSWVLTRSFQIASLSAFFLLGSPFRVHEHYIFGILSFLLITLVCLPKKVVIGLLVGATVLYLQPYYWQLYTEPAPHSVAEQRACFQQVCSKLQAEQWQPIFVNTQSASHNHQAREYVFWLRELGCQAIETQGFLVAPTQYMAVVADRATFENGKTGYYELSQFGPAQELAIISCKDDLSVHLLQKVN